MDWLMRKEYERTGPKSTRQFKLQISEIMSSHYAPFLQEPSGNLKEYVFESTRSCHEKVL
jgi:hypothetical protein